MNMITDACTHAHRCSQLLLAPISGQYWFSVQCLPAFVNCASLFFSLFLSLLFVCRNFLKIKIRADLLREWLEEKLS